MCNSLSRFDFIRGHLDLNIMLDIQKFLQGISEQSVQSNSALVKIQIWIFAIIRGPMCS